MGNLRLAGQLVGYPTVAAVLGLAYGLPAGIAHLHGRAAGEANPEYGGAVGTAGYGLGSVPIGGLLGAGLSGLAYKTGHNAGRQEATNFMLGPGFDSRQLQFHRMPGT